MEYIIKNNYLEAHINSLGAELRELIDCNGNNRMHIPNLDTWNSVSPILFPQVSRIKDNVYSVGGKDYTMNLHGFFRKNEISPSCINSDSITFTMVSNDNTKKEYPYDFQFSVKYQLIENTLKVSFITKNIGKSLMRYMVGGHPGFEIPKYNYEQYEDYFLKFETKEISNAMQVVDGYLANEFVRYLHDDDIINLKHDLFIPDAIVLTELKSKYVDLMSKVSDYHIRFHFQDFEKLAIWSLNNKKATYVCLEPWNGIPKNFVKEHENMGVLQLKPGEEKEFSYSIQIVK